MTITLTSRVRRTPDAFVDAVLDDDLVFLDVKAGQFYSLKGTGLAAWRLIDDSGGWVTVGALIAGLAAEFAVDEETCLRDVAALLEDLSAAGLVELRTNTPSTGGTSV